MGDTNAKHQELLPHTQKIALNADGVVLKDFLEGTHTGPVHGNPLAWKLHNSYTENKFTHIHNNNWCQIDLDLLKGDMTDLVDRFTYKEELQSDHKGIGVMESGYMQNMQNQRFNLYKKKSLTRKTYNT